MSTPRMRAICSDDPAGLKDHAALNFRNLDAFVERFQDDH